MTIKVLLPDGPSFVAGLVRECVTFSAVQDGNYLVITMTGGY